MHWIKSGVMRLYKNLANGRRQIIGFAFPGEFVGLGTGSNYHFSAQAIEATELRSMSKPAFEAAAFDDLQFSSKLYQAVSLDLARAYDLALTVGQRDSQASLAMFLLEMNTRTAPASGATDTVLLPMPRSDIADYLGLTTETISRNFSKFARLGVIRILGRRHIRLTERAMLLQMAEGLPETACS